MLLNTLDEVWLFFTSNYAIQYGRFSLASGRKTHRKIVGEALLINSLVGATLMRKMAELVERLAISPQAITGPAEGGNLFASALRDRLLLKKPHPEIYWVPTEKKEGVFCINAEFCRYFNGRRVLLIDDVWMTGGSLRAIVRLVEEYGGQVIGCVVAANRSGHPMKLFNCKGEEIPIAALFDLDTPERVTQYRLETWEE